MKVRTVLSIVLFSGFAAIGPAAWAADAAAGKPIYDAKCKACHGADGAGNPAIAKMMKVEIKPLATTAVDVKKVITEGQGKMKPVAISPAEVDSVAAYVKSLKK